MLLKLDESHIHFTSNNQNIKWQTEPYLCDFVKNNFTVGLHSDSFTDWLFLQTGYGDRNHLALCFDTCFDDLYLHSRSHLWTDLFQILYDARHNYTLHYDSC